MNKPWLSEPDLLDWDAHGLRCMVLRMPTLRHLCGYVGVQNGHPAHGKHYNEINVDVHGGLTFGQMGDGQRYPEGLYWLGFDCAHHGDLSPGMLKYGGSFDDGTYRDIHYVTQETEDLARQLAEMAVSTG